MFIKELGNKSSTLLLQWISIFTTRKTCLIVWYCIGWFATCSCTLTNYAVKIFYLVSNYAKVLVSNKSPFMLSDLSGMNFLNLNLQKVVVRQTRLFGKVLP